MIKSKYRWDISEPNHDLVTSFMQGLKVDRLVASVLVARGWSSLDQTAHFLQADIEHLLDPFDMKGMAVAVERIKEAVRNGEQIRVYGDYDADGVTSTVLMTRLLSELGATYDTYIPHRSREGYGLNINAIDLAAEAGIRLLITVDNGISAVEQIAYATQRGIDVIVTDHHEPPEVLPEAIALVNPKQKDCTYAFKGLCGAGVVFKLAHAMLGRPMLEYADLAAIGTIADLMPLTGENRIIARLGLDLMRRQPNAGIRALSKVCGIKPEELNSGRIGFSLAPRLNAGGRLEHADTAVKLLAATGDEEADLYAAELDKLNSERQLLVEQTVIEADELWQSICQLEGSTKRNVIVLAKEGWNAGIAGLVASKLVERYYRPVLILAVDESTGLCKGSARSIDGFDLYAALSENAELMVHFGGHQAAAGLTISREKVDVLADRLHILAEQWLSPEDWKPKRRIDLSIPLSEASLKAVEQLERLEPFGNANPRPRIVIQDVFVRESRTMGKDGSHLRLTIEQANQSMEVVAFGMGEQRDRLAPGTMIDLLGELSINEWNGNRKVQVMLHDYRSQHIQLQDRRKDNKMWSTVEEHINNQSSGLVIGCGSKAIFQEAISQFSHTGVPIRLLSESSLDARLVMETAVASEENSAEGANLLEEWRHLILLGLPCTQQEVSTLEQWLSPQVGGECVTVFSDLATNQQVTEGNAAFPDRKQFGEIYAMCRARGSWLDSPNGFVQEIALKTGKPLSTLRMMLDVFTELGFIAAEGASRKFVKEPPRRDLEQSERYRKAREQSNRLRLSEMTTEELQQWLISCHSKVPS
ncbi:single-stranded-DNA-specific exonuclease RecJ [Cohnella abietis]|uniref:Single-stranded-DNA-specific exonuclease RecJ n=2 Tax=Cohnella abietis TaxID=2507935 RepID=A0A3T1D3F4_9BACL|nr:single-stranded-DNA-specific exonuclease RecJ [Cohnella abietis]